LCRVFRVIVQAADVKFIVYDVSIFKFHGLSIAGE
jgi:hypothetical protein